jgi:rubrerythrin
MGKVPEQQTICEVIRVAIQREEEAYSFFMAMSKAVQSIGIASMFKDLAKEELEHKEKLKLELMKLGEVVEPDDTSRSTEDLFYIEADEFEQIDYADMLRLCIEKEDISFRLYLNLASQIHNEDSREALLAMAEEELRHKIRFENEYAKLPHTK